MPKELLKVLLAAELTVLGGAFAATPAPAPAGAAGQSIKRVAAYELLSMKALRADRGPGGDENGGCKQG